MNLGPLCPAKRELGAGSQDVTGGVTEEVARPAPAPRERVGWALCFDVISGAPPSAEACFRGLRLVWAAGERCESTVRSRQPCWSDTMGVTW